MRKDVLHLQLCRVGLFHGAVNVAEKLEHAVSAHTDLCVVLRVKANLEKRENKIICTYALSTADGMLIFIMCAFFYRQRTV